MIGRRLQWDVANFIEEEPSLIGEFNAPNFPRDGPSKCPSFVTKEFTFIGPKYCRVPVNVLTPLPGPLRKHTLAMCHRDGTKRCHHSEIGGRSKSATNWNTRCLSQGCQRR
jgi:hypothetical protein